MALILNNKFWGYYKVKSMNSVSNEKTVIEFDLDNYTKLNCEVDASAVNDNTAVSFSHEEFLDYCNSHKV